MKVVSSYLVIVRCHGGGLCNVVKHYISQYISQFSHIVFSTTQVIAILRTVVWQPEYAFATLDIKDFFMAATHSTHVESTRRIGDLRFLCDAIDFLLSHQYVKDPGTGLHYQVVVGPRQAILLEKDMVLVCVAIQSTDTDRIGKGVREHRLHIGPPLSVGGKTQRNFKG